MEDLFGSYSYSGKGKGDSLTKALYVGFLHGDIHINRVLALILHGDLNFLGEALELSDFCLLIRFCALILP